MVLVVVVVGLLVVGCWLFLVVLGCCCLLLFVVVCCCRVAVALAVAVAVAAAVVVGFVVNNFHRQPFFTGSNRVSQNIPTIAIAIAVIFPPLLVGVFWHELYDVFVSEYEGMPVLVFVLTYFGTKLKRGQTYTNIIEDVWLCINALPCCGVCFMLHYIDQGMHTLLVLYHSATGLSRTALVCLFSWRIEISHPLRNIFYVQWEAL